jgi:hypothetical protein
MGTRHRLIIAPANAGPMHPPPSLEAQQLAQRCSSSSYVSASDAPSHSMHSIQPYVDGRVPSARLPLGSIAHKVF